MEENFKKYLASIAYFPKFGPVRIRILMLYFKSPEKIFKANIEEIIKSGISEKLAQEFIEFKNSINPDKIWDELQKENIKIVTIEELQYPKLLHKIYTPPYLLFYRGELPSQNNLNLAFVGSRKYTQYGKYSVNHIISGLKGLDINIISGLALGIDTISHQLAIETGLKTIAVLGSGIDDFSIYPQSNRVLVNNIIENGGAIISEFPPRTRALRHHFPQRNRIVAGMSLGTVVIEAEKKSGALITSKYALDENRDVFALPGQINSQTSIGTNNLIKSGAIPITSADDIIELYNLEKQEIVKKDVNLNKIEKLIFSYLSHEPLHVNEISKITNIAIHELNSNLTIMEIKGIIKNIGGMQYIKM